MVNGREDLGIELPEDRSVRLVLARHGQTPANVQHSLDTLPPGPELTDEGHRQAGALAERLVDEPVLSVHASVATRAQQTAQPLATHRELGINVVDGMHEVYVGELEKASDARSRQIFEDIYASWHHGELDRPMPAGETGRQALTRFCTSARDVIKNSPDGTLMLVSHGAMLRLVAGHLAVNVDQLDANAAYLPNTGLIVLESSQHGWECTHWDGLA